MTSIKLAAPAKVNLFLKVLNKRKDGYHNILTVFERISLADTISISKAPAGIAVKCDRFVTRRPEDNIAYKAAELIIRREGIKSGVRIEIKKAVPIGAGLGGGSSDAAAVLMGMNKLFGLGLSRDRLIGLSAVLGADVPFFMLDTPFAIGRSKGDKVERISSGKRLWHLIIYPGFRLSTKGVYEAFEAIPKSLTTLYDDDKIMAHLTDTSDSSELESMLYNDLEEIAASKKKIIGKIIERLAYSLNKKAIVTGSGPSVFCLYATRKEADRARRKLFRSMPAAGRQGWQIFVTDTKIN